MALDSQACVSGGTTTTIKPPGPQVSSTQKPGTTTVNPQETTEKPEATSVNPEETTEIPANTTVNPEGTTVKPGNTTAVPEETTVNPGNTSENPGNSTVNPGNSTEKPGNTTVNPGNTTENPGNSTGNPGTPTPMDPCYLAPEAGACNNSLSRYYFDASSKQCVAFTFSGCGGNSNNFITLEKCRETCGVAAEDGVSK